MKITVNSVYVGSCAGILFALLAAIPPAASDWYDNPGGIFRTESGTNWDFLFETWFSWFWPIALAAVPVAILVHAWVSNRSASITVNASNNRDEP